MGLVWLRKPTLLHSSRDGYPLSKFGPVEVALVTHPFRSWYNADYAYGRGTIYFFCAAIGIVALATFFSRIRSRSSARTSPTITRADRFVAATRYTTARQFYVKSLNFYTPPLASILAISGIFTFVIGLTFAVRPYYWPVHTLGHSPPIATRTGWISIALMPFMIAFATKVNLVGMITDTSHEKLQVFHRWTALIMYLTSLIHTFPFIIDSIESGIMEINWKTTPWYWTGVAALVPQTWLVAMSWGPIRNRYYETFKKLHFIAGSIFMAALFVHCNFRLTSWDYFIATGAIYFSTYIFRYGRIVYNSGFGGLQATVQQLPHEMVSLSVNTPERLKWTPGQHVFIRVLSLGVHALSSHPFTVTNLSQTVDEETKKHKIELAFRAHGGITKRLYELAEGKTAAAAKVSIDGPYGGISTPLKNYDKLYLLAGGSGVTFTLPLLLDLAQSYSAGIRCKSVEFVLTVRAHDALDWLRDDIATARSFFKDGLTVNLHVSHSANLPTAIVGDKESTKSSSAASDQEVVSGRPALPAIIHEAVTTSSGRIAIVACGPNSFMYDVRRAVANAQLAILDGFGNVNEIFLHSENYSW